MKTVLGAKELVRSGWGGCWVAFKGSQQLSPDKEASPVQALEQQWFPLSLVTLGALLAVLGALAGFNGLTLALLPGELAAGLLWWSKCPLLAQLALLDQTQTLQGVLDSLAGRRSEAAALGVAWLALQSLTLVLGCCLCCCTPSRRRKHPWSRYWDGDAALEEEQAPLLPRAAVYQRGSPPASTAGYRTPPSRFASPAASPERPNRAAFYPSPQRVAQQPGGGRAIASFPILSNSDE
ncbi:hypothetical protein N2152v2_003694 [Parachlorella kessleri]